MVEKNIFPELKDLKNIVEERGRIVQYFNNDFPTDIKRIYIVENFNKDTIRGFHKNFNETKYFTVLKGSVRFVCINENNEIYTYTLSSKKPQLLIIPEKWWNGWKALEEDTLLYGMANTILEEHKDERCPYDSFGMKIWEVKNR